MYSHSPIGRHKLQVFQHVFQCSIPKQRKKLTIYIYICAFSKAEQTINNTICICITHCRRPTQPSHGPCCAKKPRRRLAMDVADRFSGTVPSFRGEVQLASLRPAATLLKQQQFQRTRAKLQNFVKGKRNSTRGSWPYY